MCTCSSFLFGFKCTEPLALTDVIFNDCNVTPKIKVFLLIVGKWKQEKITHSLLNILMLQLMHQPELPDPNLLLNYD